MEQLQQSITTPPTVSDTASLPSTVTNPTISPLLPDMGAIIQQCVAQAFAVQNMAAQPAPAPAPRSDIRQNNRRRPMAARTTCRYNISNYCGPMAVNFTQPILAAPASTQIHDTDVMQPSATCWVAARNTSILSASLHPLQRITDDIGEGN